MHYDGVNQHSVVGVDNASIHHLEHVQDIITDESMLFPFCQLGGKDNHIVLLSLSGLSTSTARLRMVYS